jgi:hypothetical protein
MRVVSCRACAAASAEIDPLYTGGRVVDKFADGKHEIIYAAYSSGFNLVVSPRDFLYLEGSPLQFPTKALAPWRSKSGWWLSAHSGRSPPS